jgi:23S rRNA (pseudouridine1915-N3)-methyltransferase
VRRRESRALLELHDGRGTLVALDPRGRLLTSPELAERLERWATPRATFLVGGPLGLADEILRDAAVRWSLSPLTFPHELVPALLAEQLYRALCILRGSPYHKPRAADA